MVNKILFWFDTSILYFGIANSLQQKNNCELYAIFDIPERRKKFFEEQTIVNFKKFWFYHDNIFINENPDLEYLENIEKKYELNLWLLAINSRHFFDNNQFYNFSRNEILSILESEIKLFEKILEISPDYILISTNEHQNKLFFEMCKSKGIKILTIMPNRIGGKVMIMDSEQSILKSPVINESKYQEKTFEDVQNLIANMDSFQENKKLTESNSKINLLKAALQFLLISKNTVKKTQYTYFGRTKIKVLIRYFIDWFTIRRRKNFIDKNFQTKIKDEKFIFFPLHMQPESPILLDAPFYTNQLEIIRHIAKSIPISYKLYVKEHNSMYLRGWRNTNYYKELLKLPNVELFHPSISPKEILKKCSLVITINGTAGFEASFYGKPTILLSDVLYEKLPSVTKINNILDLPNAIKDTIKRKIEPAEVYGFVDFLIQNSIDFSVQQFAIDELNHFFYGGNLADKEITSEQMMLFLEIHKKTFDLLTNEHLKFIKNL